MRAAPAAYAATYSNPTLRPCWDVTSWLGKKFLGSIEVKSATITETAAETVPGKLELTVANVPAWRPSSPTAPLGAFGQQLRVRTGWRDALGRPVVWFDLGRFRIHRPAAAYDVLTVTGDSLHQLVENARFVTATPYPAGTFKSRVAALLKSILPVSFDPALVDRAVKKQTYDRERMEALADTLAAWPAQLEVLPSGVGYITTPWESRPVKVQATYSDGEGGTVTDVTPEAGDVSDIPNAVVAASEPDDGKAALTETAYTKAGPLAWGGPYGFVPDFYSSPLLTTRAQLQAAAKTRLAKLQRTTQQVRVSMVDDPRLQLGDVVRVVCAKRSTNVVGRVIVVEHGVTPADRQVENVLSVLSGVVDGVSV